MFNEDQLKSCAEEFCSDYEQQSALRKRYSQASASHSRAQQKIEFRCFNEGSDAAWNSWPIFPDNPYRAGTLEYQGWEHGARTSFAWRQDHADFGIPIAGAEAS